MFLLLMVHHWLVATRHAESLPTTCHSYQWKKPLSKTLMCPFQLAKDGAGNLSKWTIILVDHLFFTESAQQADMRHRNELLSCADTDHVKLLGLAIMGRNWVSVLNHHSEFKLKRQVMMQHWPTETVDGCLGDSRMPHTSSVITIIPQDRNYLLNPWIQTLWPYQCLSGQR